MDAAYFKQHNKEVRLVWDSYHQHNPVRMPVIFGLNPRFILMNPSLNKEQTEFKNYFSDPEIMLNTIIKLKHYIAHNIKGDHEMGIPEEGWTVHVDFQNVLESVWLGCPLVFPDGFPATIPILDDMKKNQLFYKGVVDPFSGIMSRCRNFYEYFEEIRKSEKIYFGAPIKSVEPVFLVTDGPFTLACNLRGSSNMCIDLIEDIDYAIELMDYITEATINRIIAWRKYHGLKTRQPNFFFADDSIVLLSTDMYRRLVLPFHKRLIKALCTNMPDISVHLCGDATRHFKVMKEELSVSCFDTGYPVNYANLVCDLGNNVRINGGPPTTMLLNGTVDEIITETQRIIDDVKNKTDRFVMRDANNVSPGTPISNLNAVYETVRQHGWYR